MSNIPGNPHAELSEAAQTTEGALIHATLALAYEQRTANLIAYIETVDDTDRETMIEIRERLELVAAK